MPQPSIVWKKIVDQFVLEKTQMKASLDTEICRIRRKKGRFELGPCNCVALEAYTLWVKKRAMELKMHYPCERPMSMVVVEPLTLPNQDVEDLEDALIKMKQEKDM
ncbi:hypothetical protein KIW84_064312 [Lathyrus oleraceus]|uniref:Uncharacterized protein n=1 Tax=Pisum sativum TaxID=3888 RepID=A0A9D5A805_PEA|nr:hypothetical protein KIW84_064312 [Pisum sativum]